MHAGDIAETFPVVSIDSAVNAARLRAEHRLPGIVVTDSPGRPYAVLPASQVVGLRSPLIAVMKHKTLRGVITASRLWSAVLGH